MSELETMGVAVTRRYLSSSTNVNGVALSTNETTELTLALPRETPLQATFSKEGLGRKLLKIFKKELQTGDAEFDSAIYISTDTMDETKKLLESPEVRRAIAALVSTGGPIEIDGMVMTTEIGGRDETGEPAEALVIVRALLS